MEGRAKVMESRFEVDEIRVSVVVREIVDGETVNKHVAEPLVFVNERAFREWSAKPMTISSRDEQPA